MAMVVITHAVKDIETWLQGKAERAASFSPFASNVTDHVAMDGSKSIAITADVHDMAGLRAALSSPPPEMVDAMERHGVIQPLSVYLDK